MLHDATWLRLARRDEDLCGDCVFERASERDIELTFADLRPCEFNLFHSPDSWFDMFAGWKTLAEADPTIAAAWIAAARSSAAEGEIAEPSWAK